MVILAKMRNNENGSISKKIAIYTLLVGFIGAAAAVVSTTFKGIELLSDKNNGQESVVQKPSEFVCIEGDKETAFKAYNPEKVTTIITWKTKYFEPSGYDPLTRCREVSSKFQKLHTKGMLNFLTWGEKEVYTKGDTLVYTIICAAKKYGGPCMKDGQLFTLMNTPEDKGRVNDYIDGLLGARELGTGTGITHSLNKSIVSYYDGRIYINMKEYLKNKKVKKLNDQPKIWKIPIFSSRIYRRILELFVFISKLV